MSPQDPNIYKRLLERDYWRICQLATTAEHKERIYKTSKGLERRIKARPPSVGILPLGRSTIYDLVRKGDMPAPVRLVDNGEII